MVADYKKSNEKLMHWSYPLMGIDRIFSKCHRLDIRSGYYNATVAEDSQKYTSITAEYAKYEFLYVSFGNHITLVFCHNNKSNPLRTGLLFCLLR